jgi:hypothetical protein
MSVFSADFSSSAYGFLFATDASHTRFLIVPAILHFAENTFALQLLLKKSQSMFYVIVSYCYLQFNYPLLFFSGWRVYIGEGDFSQELN